MHWQNTIGRVIAKLRFQRGWSQKTLAAKVECLGVPMSCEIIANVESGRTKVTAEQLAAFQKAFGVTLVELFPPEVRQSDEKAARLAKLREQALAQRPSIHA